MRLRPALSLVVLISLLAGCAGGVSLRPAPAAPEVPLSVIHDPGEDVTRPAPRPHAAPRPHGRSAAALDTTSPAERAAATAGSAGGRVLGETLASLGPPGEGGFWLRTGLVSRERPGRVVTAQGASVALELRPSGREAGSGSQISLAAMRALGLPLTRLAPLTVRVLD